MLFAEFAIKTTVESCADPSGQVTTPARIDAASTSGMLLD